MPFATVYLTGNSQHFTDIAFSCWFPFSSVVIFSCTDTGLFISQATSQILQTATSSCTCQLKLFVNMITVNY